MEKERYPRNAPRQAMAIDFPRSPEHDPHRDQEGHLAILEKEVTGQGMVMDSTSPNSKEETETLAKVEKLFSELAAAKKKE